MIPLLKKIIAYKKIFVVILLLSSTLHALCQESEYAIYLQKMVNNAQGEKQKVYWLGQLARLYWGINRERSDSLIREETIIADKSNDENKELTIQVYLDNANRYLQNAGNLEENDTAITICQNAVQLAKDNNQSDFGAFAYLQMATANRNIDDYDRATSCDNSAQELAATSKNDSLLVELYISKATTDIEKEGDEAAAKNYLTAVLIAEKTNNYYLLLKSYLFLADLYIDRQEYDEALDYLGKLEKNCIAKYDIDYNDLIGIYLRKYKIYYYKKDEIRAQLYYQQGMQIADSLHEYDREASYYLAILNNLMSEGKYNDALEYLQKNYDPIEKYYQQKNMLYAVNCYYMRIYTEINDFNNALSFYHKASEEITYNANDYWRFYFNYYTAVFCERVYAQKPDSYSNAADVNSYDSIAFNCIFAARKIAYSTKNLPEIAQANSFLEILYSNDNQYDMAYYYRKLTDSCNNILRNRNDAKEVFIAKLNKEKQSAILKEEELKQAHNIQYMGITAMLATCFIILVMLGYFKVSETTIKIIGFFAFIFLFEFVVMLVDTNIHSFTHDEPWKDLLVKIGLAAIMLPLHHRVEQKVIHYLTSRRMIERPDKLTA